MITQELGGHHCCWSAWGWGRLKVAAHSRRKCRRAQQIQVLPLKHTSAIEVMQVIQRADRGIRSRVGWGREFERLGHQGFDGGAE